MPIPLGVLAVAGAGGAAAGAYDLIETVIPSGTTGTVTFSSIPQTYKHLQLRMSVRHDEVSSAVLEDCLIRFNGVSTNTYASHLLSGTGSTPTSTAFTTRASMLGIKSTSPSAVANIHTGVVLDILNYTSDTNKTIRGINGVTAAVNDITLFSGVYLDTPAVTSISILSPNTTTKPFRFSSRFSLYGIAG